MKFKPGCNCCFSPCTINGTVNACTTYAGAPWSATQGGVSVGSGTADGSGHFTLTVTSSVNVVITVPSPDSARLNAVTATVTPTSGGTISRTLTLTNKSGYTCFSCNGTSCLWPIKDTLTLTSPSGNTVTLTRSGTAWSGGVGDTQSVACCDTTPAMANVTVNWLLTSGLGAGPCIQGSVFCCASPCRPLSTDTCAPCSDGFAHPRSGYGGGLFPCTTSFSFGSLTCPESGTFTVTGNCTMPTGLASGTATVTE